MDGNDGAPHAYLDRHGFSLIGATELLLQSGPAQCPERINSLVFS